MKQLGLGFIILWLGLVFSYWRSLGYSYVDFDDPSYLHNNPLSSLSIVSGAFWEQLWTTSTVNLWHPLTVLSHQVMLRVTSDWGIHHGVNIILHGTTATLWGVFLYRVIKKPLPVIIASVLYAWHPVTVESVAWLSGRKDLLCGLFIILTFLFHLEWSSKKKRIYYILSFCAGCLAMLCKPIAFLIPVILLLLDLYFLHRKIELKGRLKELLPWVIPTVTTVLLTLIFQSQGGQSIEDSRSMLYRGAGALWAFKKALVSSFLPVNLHLGYEDPQVLSFGYIAVISVLISILFILVFYYYKKAPYILAGVLIFGLFLSPTVGLIRAGNHLAADRYCYLPLLGLSLIVACALANRKLLVLGFFSLISISFLILQQKQVSSWESLETLSLHTLKISPNNPSANAQMAYIHSKDNEEKEAIYYLEKVFMKSPEHAGANLLRAKIAKDNQDWETAEHHYEVASNTRSNDVLIWYQLAHSLLAQNKDQEGLEILKKAHKMCQDPVLLETIESDMQVLMKGESKK